MPRWKPIRHRPLPSIWPSSGPTLKRDVVDAAVIQGRYELPRIEHTRYWAFVDPSGGSSDSMTLCVSHMQGNRVIVDAIRERKSPFSPDACVKEFSDAL